MRRSIKIIIILRRRQGIPYKFIAPRRQPEWAKDPPKYFPLIMTFWQLGFSFKDRTRSWSNEVKVRVRIGSFRSLNQNHLHPPFGFIAWLTPSLTLPHQKLESANICQCPSKKSVTCFCNYFQLEETEHVNKKCILSLTSECVKRQCVR